MEVGKGSSLTLPNESFPVTLEYLKSNLLAKYPSIKFFDDKDNFFKAIGYSDLVIFKLLLTGKTQQIIKTIEIDIKAIDVKTNPYKSIIYISYDNKFYNPLHKKRISSKINSDYPFDIIPFSYIVDNSNKLSDNYLPLTGLVDKDLKNKNNYQIIVPIINRIFEFVNTIPDTNLPDPPKPDSKEWLPIENKIIENFDNIFHRDVQNDVLAFWQQKTVIENFIKKSYYHNRRQFDALKSLVVNTYLGMGMQKSDEPVNDSLIFNKIANAILPVDLKDNQDACDCAKAVVYYFFEYCLFGKKSKYDDPEFEFKAE